MPTTSKCFVPGCRSGYAKQVAEMKASGQRLNSLFIPPKDEHLFKEWKHRLQRADRTLTPNDKVCALHFEEKYLLKYWETKMPDGSIHRLERGKWSLAPGAVPSKFDFAQHFLLSRSVEIGCILKLDILKMGRKCFVPNCRTGYSTRLEELKAAGKKEFSLFQPLPDPETFRQWKMKIPRVDRELRMTDTVCELHFEDHCVQRSQKYIIDGKEVIVPRTTPFLAPGSVPTIFPGPSCLTTRTKKRKIPLKRAPVSKKKVPTQGEGEVNSPMSTKVLTASEGDESRLTPVRANSRGSQKRTNGVFIDELQLPKKGKCLKSDGENDDSDDHISWDGINPTSVLELELEPKSEPELIEDAAPSPAPIHPTEPGKLTIEDILELESTITSWSFIRLSNGSIMLAYIDTQDYSIKKRIVIEKDMKALVFIGLVLVKFEGNEYLHSVAQFDTLMMLTDSINPCPNAFSKSTGAMYPCRGYSDTGKLCFACSMNGSVTYDTYDGHDLRQMIRGIIAMEGLPPYWFTSLLPNDSAMIAYMDKEGDSAAISKRIHVDPENYSNQLGVNVYLGLVKVGVEGYDSVLDVDTLQRLVRIVDEMKICSNAFYKTSVEREHPCLGYRVRDSVCVTCSLEINGSDGILKLSSISKWVRSGSRVTKCRNTLDKARVRNIPDTESGSDSCSDSSADPNESENVAEGHGKPIPICRKTMPTHAETMETVVTSRPSEAEDIYAQNVPGPSRALKRLKEISEPSHRTSLNAPGKNKRKLAFSRLLDPEDYE